MTPTVHIEAKKEEIAKTVIMPGDPLRAKYIADNFLENVILFNKVRNNFGFTGTYKGKKVSVMGSGMGCPSIGIYSYELYNFYDVENIIRVGTAGAINESLKLKDIIFAQGACTDSNYSLYYNLPGYFSPISDYNLLSLTVKEAERLSLSFKVGNVLSSGFFYTEDDLAYKKWQRIGVLAIEMETSMLYFNAAILGKKALSILTISDYIFKEGKLSSKEREQGLNAMVSLALNTALYC